MKYRIFTISQCSIKFNLFLVLCCVDLTLTADLKQQPKVEP